MYQPFGQVGIGVTMVGTAAANAALDIRHALELNKLSQQFKGKLDDDAANMQYLKLLLTRFKSLGIRLARTTRARPGTPEFDKLLRVALKDDMNYKGYCEADIYVPFGRDDKRGTIRPIWGSITKSGHISAGRLPRDIGPIWAAGCKGAYDEFKIAYINAYKGKRRFKHLKSSKEDIGTTGLFLKFGTGLLLAGIMLMMIKVQLAVVKKQSGIK